MGASRRRTHQLRPSPTPTPRVHPRVHARRPERSASRAPNRVPRPVPRPRRPTPRPFATRIVALRRRRERERERRREREIWKFGIRTAARGCHPGRRRRTGVRGVRRGSRRSRCASSEGCDFRRRLRRRRIDAGTPHVHARPPRVLRLLSHASFRAAQTHVRVRRSRGEAPRSDVSRAVHAHHRQRETHGARGGSRRGSRSREDAARQRRRASDGIPGGVDGTVLPSQPSRSTRARDRSIGG